MAFIVEIQTLWLRGVRQGPMGLHGSHSGDLFFEDREAPVGNVKREGGGEGTTPSPLGVCRRLCKLVCRPQPRGSCVKLLEMKEGARDDAQA